MICFLRGIFLFLWTHWIPSSEYLYFTNASQWSFCFASCPIKSDIFSFLIKLFVKFFLNVCICVAILLRVQRLIDSSDSTGTVKFFFSSCQSHSFFLSGTASLCLLGLLAFYNLKLIRMWSLTRHPHCLFFAAASGAIGLLSGATSVMMNHTSNFFVGPRFFFSATPTILTALKIYI